MNFTPTIDLGNIIALVVMLFTFWRFHQSNIRRLHKIEFQVGLMWKSFAHRFNLPEDLLEENNGS